jgi:hypothetical protein
VEWLHFIRTRLNPVTNFAIAFGLTLSGASLPTNSPHLVPLVWGTVGLFVFLLTQALIEEVQSFESDLSIYQDRPLQQGVISHFQTLFLIRILMDSGWSSG